AGPCGRGKSTAKRGPRASGEDSSGFHELRLERRPLAFRKQGFHRPRRIELMVLRYSPSYQRIQRRRWLEVSALVKRAVRKAGPIADHSAAGDRAADQHRGRTGAVVCPAGAV